MLCNYHCYLFVPVSFNLIDYYVPAGSMGQLPAYILFSHGSEVARYPELVAESKGSRSPITKVHQYLIPEMAGNLLAFNSGTSLFLSISNLDFLASFTAVY